MGTPQASSGGGGSYLIRGIMAALGLVVIGGAWVFSGSTGIKIGDSDNSHTISLKSSSNEAADRTLYLPALGGDVYVATSTSDVGDLGTMATQNANAVAITGGTVTGITDLAVADGGTGASTAAAGFDALAPTTTRGDVIFRNATTNARLAKGAAGTVLTMGANDPEWATPSGSAGGLGIYGTGVDGDGTMDGAATIYGLSPSSNVYTATADIYADDLTINSGIRLEMDGYRLFVKGTLTNGGFISCNGTDATSATAGTVKTNRTAFKGSTLTGVAGSGTTTNGGNGSNRSTSLGGAGGAGGAGSGGTGGAGGTATAPNASNGGINVLSSIAQALDPRTPTATPANYAAGSGGGGGGGDTTDAGGGGGSGASYLLVIAKTVAGSGAFEAKGGNGFTPVAGNCGGGGGGGGGILVLISSTGKGSCTFNVAGGTKGNGVGTGTNGTDGSAGNSFDIVN